MRASATLLIVSTAFTSSSAQSGPAVPVFSGPTAVTPVVVPVLPPAQQAPRGYSRATYSRPSRPSRGTYSRSTWGPQGTYSRSAYPQTGNSRAGNYAPAPPNAPVSNPPAVSVPSRSPVGHTPGGTAFGTPYSRQVRQTDAVTGPAAEQQRKIREEQWRQYQIQEAQRQADFQKSGDTATQRFWQDIYLYNRSTYNQNRHGYSNYGQSRIGQNHRGSSSYGQTRAGQ
ncbi:MAG: hypothetical protein VB858_07415, partial [Planctomycetaceae bacterium]